MKEETIHIEKLAFGGAGLGHLAGKVCFVPFTAPGDTARIRVKSEKRSYQEGELRELLTPAPERVVPPCPVFGSCGGCNWQHLSYDAQLAAKQEIFAELLWRCGRVPRERLLPIVAAPGPYGYRARTQFKLRFIAGELHIGFYRGGSHFVVDLPGRCAIADPAINRLFTELGGLMAHFPEPDKVPQIDVAIGDDDAALLVFHYIGSRHEETARWLAQRWHDPATGLHLQSGRKATMQQIAAPGALSYLIPANFLPGVPERRLTFSAGGFSQVNYRQNLALIATVFDWAALTGRETVLDLYCGNGNFSIPLAHCAAKVVGVEDYEPSLRDARRNCQQNGVANAVFHCSDAASALAGLAQGRERFDLVVLDPPRTGAAELVRQIPLVKPAKIIYISCDPATLARDIGILGKHGYQVVKSVPVDMFPQTYHIESVTLLEPAAMRE
ncbi:MAG: 23S rRNA (uracil(1939)-C(5))-methyltransferase RlmD [Geobacteraceae bacterium]|nr:23S rRNA (uracil(1939)-C(5))-methyltransferase RlmD [Geobacteraceae bacterium]